MTECPGHFNRADWLAAYDAELAAIRRHGQPARRDMFNAEFPPPYRGEVTAQASARFAAICDRTKDAR